jgi:hypothetical protein
VPVREHERQRQRPQEQHRPRRGERIERERVAEQHERHRERAGQQDPRHTGRAPHHRQPDQRRRADAGQEERGGRQRDRGLVEERVDDHHGQRRGHREAGDHPGHIADLPHPRRAGHGATP